MNEYHGETKIYVTNHEADKTNYADKSDLPSTDTEETTHTDEREVKRENYRNVNAISLTNLNSNWNVPKQC